MTTSALYDLEDEKAVIASIQLHGNGLLEDVLATGLEPGHFYDQRHRIIYRTQIKLAADGIPIDGLTLKKALEESGQLDDVGFLYLAQLTDGIPLNLEIPWYCREIIRLSGERRIISAAANLQTAALNGDLPAALEDIRKALDDFEPENGSREHRGLTRKVGEYIDASEGVFSTNQVYSDLGITDAKGKMAVRQALSRLNGTAIQAYGDKSGFWRVIRGDVQEMDLENIDGEELQIWLPFDLHNYVQIMEGNLIVVTGDPDAGKTAFLLNTIKRNIKEWDCHYFNSEMGAFELRKRLNLFKDFPINHPHFHAYERGDGFQDVVQPGKYVLNLIDFLEITEEFYLIAKHLADIYKNLHGSIALIAIQKKSKTCDLPLGAQRALEKPRLAVSLSAGSRMEPNRATILKCKNRKTEHSMIGRTRTFKLIGGSEFRCDSPEWI